MARLREVVLDPADRSRGWALYGNGVIQTFGGAAVPDFVAPEQWGDATAQSLQVLDPVTPGGYVLSWTGTIWPFGGMPTITGNQNTGSTFPIWRRLRMHPAANGQGYQMDFNGRIYQFGTPLPGGLVGGAGTLTPNGVIAGGINWGQDIARDFVIDWVTRKWAVVSGRGDLVGSFGFDFLAGGNDARPYYPDNDVYRALLIMDYAQTAPRGYLGARQGRIYAFNAQQKVTNEPVYPNLDVLVDLNYVQDGLNGDPLELESDLYNGTRQRFIVSRPPTVTISLAQPSPVTTTTRPGLFWNYNDPDQDRQGSWRIKIYDPFNWSDANYDDNGAAVVQQYDGTDPDQRAVNLTADLTNGSYRAFIWVVDAAGNRSDPAYVEFSVNVVRPGAPSITVAIDTVNLGLRVVATKGANTPAGSRLAVEYLDDDGSWQTAWGSYFKYDEAGNQIDLTYNILGKAVVVDVEAPFNKARTYRARTFSLGMDPNPDGGPTIASDPSASVSGTLTFDGWVLSDPRRTGLWLELNVTPDFRLLKDTGGVKYSRRGARGLTVFAGRMDDQIELPLWVLERESFEPLEVMLASGRVLQLRDQFSRSWFVTPYDQYELNPVKAGPQPNETTRLRYAQQINLPLTEVARPDPAPILGDF